MRLQLLNAWARSGVRKTHRGGHQVHAAGHRYLISAVILTVSIDSIVESRFVIDNRTNCYSYPFYRNGQGDTIHFITYEQMIADTLSVLTTIPREVDLVIGIPRSGMTPAAILASELHKPLGVPGSDRAYYGLREGNISDTIKKILLVDDSVYEGKAFTKAEKEIRKIYPEAEIIKLCLYLNPKSDYHVDLHVKKIEIPRMFEWNLFNSAKLNTTITDMDGVLCTDPEVFDDDGIAYQEALKNAKPLHLPGRPVHAICTNRLERWREITEEWLKRNGVTYGELHMTQFPTADERRKNSSPARYKGAIYKKDAGAKFFIESSKVQSRGIARVSGKMVICLEDKKIYTAESDSLP